MPVRIEDGWLSGSIPGPARQYLVEKHECPRPGNQAYLPLTKRPANLVLHTTEGTSIDSGINTLRLKFAPSQFIVGEHRIAQLRPVWAQGASTDASNGPAMQIETVADSNRDLWLPAPPTLSPLIALVAWLDTNHHIATLERHPQLASLPLVLDRMPAASDNYYRRHLGVWPADGAYGHVDLPQDEHWDPGSFDWPTFTEMVRTFQQTLEDDEMTPEQEAKLDALAAEVAGLKDALAQLKERDSHWYRGHTMPAREDPPESDDVLAFRAGQKAIGYKAEEVPPPTKNR